MEWKGMPHCTDAQCNALQEFRQGFQNIFILFFDTSLPSSQNLGFSPYKSWHKEIDDKSWPGVEKRNKNKSQLRIALCTMSMYFLVSHSKPSFRGFGSQNPLDFSSRGHQGNLLVHLNVSI